MCALPDPRSAPPHAKYHGTPAPSSPCPCHHGWPHACNTRQLLHPQPPLSLDRPVRRRAASKQSIEAVNTPQYWRALCPELHVADEAFQARCLQRFRRQGAESAGTLAALREVRCASPPPPPPHPWTAPVSTLGACARSAWTQTATTRGRPRSKAGSWTSRSSAWVSSGATPQPLPPHSLHTAAATTARPYACVWPRE